MESMSKSKSVVRRIKTGIKEVDQLLGGGLVPGNVVLFKGRRGLGNTVLSAQIANGARGKSLFATNWIPQNAIAEYLARFNCTSANMGVLCSPEGIDIDELFNAALKFKAKTVVVNSLQYCYSKGIKAKPSSLKMIREVFNRVQDFAVRNKIAFIVICLETKTGDFAGPKSIQHMADALLSLKDAAVYHNRVRVEVTEGLRELIISKSRQSKSGNALIEFVCNGPRAGFRSPSDRALHAFARAQSDL